MGGEFVVMKGVLPKRLFSGLTFVARNLSLPEVPELGTSTPHSPTIPTRSSGIRNFDPTYFYESALAPGDGTGLGVVLG